MHTNTTDCIFRDRNYLSRGFHRIIPIGWACKSNQLDLTDLLLACQENVRMGYCPNSNLYVRQITWNWDKFPFHYPVSNITLALVIGMYVYSQNLMLNCGNANFQNLFDYEKYSINLELDGVSDNDIQKAIDDAIIIIKALATVMYMREPHLNIASKHYFEAAHIVQLATMASSSCELLSISERTRIKQNKMFAAMRASTKPKAI